MPETRTVLVVGGGITGLTTAAYLAKRNVNVILLEKNPYCGGLVNSFEKDGFVFDGGVRAIENAGMVLPMLDELGIDLPLLESKVSVGIEDEVIHAVGDQSINDYESLLKGMYPESTEDVDRVIGVIKKFKQYMNVLFGDESPFYKDKKRHRAYYITTFIPWLFRFLVTGAAIMRMQKPVEDFLHKIIDNQSLFDMISQHFFKNTPAFFAMSYFSLYSDYYYPKGGVGRLTEQLEKRFVEMGGTLHLNTHITQVNQENKSVVDTDGQVFAYDKLIWCADLKSLYRMIDTEDLGTAHKEDVLSEKSRILSAKGAESVFTVFLEVGMAPDYFGSISHGHFFYTPSRLGLGSLHREDLRNMLDTWENTSKEVLFSWLDDFLRLNTFEVSLPVLNDSDTAPEGKTGVIISFLMDYELMVRIEEHGWYEDVKNHIEDTVVKIFDSSIYPGIAEHVTAAFSSSPLSIERHAGSSEGSIVGWSFEQPIPINVSMLNMKKAMLTSMPDIYKAGQWTASPAGLPTCIMTAKMAADRVLKDM
jgi:phytoene dehydrogenase-like protein